MDTTDQETTFLVERTTTLAFESAVTARQKRMEIRRVKKFSSSSGQYSAQQGVFKRFRPFRSSSICSVCYHDIDGEDDCDSFVLSKLSSETSRPYTTKLLAQIEVPHAHGVMGGCISTGSGLVRSKSLPQGPMHTGGCVLHITKASHDHGAMKVEGHIMNVVNGKHGSIVKEVSSELYSLSAGVTNSVDPGKSMGLAGEMPSGGKEVLPVAAQEARKSVLGLNPGDSSNSVSGQHSEVSAPVVPASSSARTNLQLLRRCPLSGKVLVCGRRREMEDTAVIATSFMRIPFNGNPDKYCDLHFYAVYDGHGGSQASNFCAGRLHHALAEELAGSSVSEGMEDDSKWKTAMASCFLKMDKEVGGVCPNGACGEGAVNLVACCANAIAPENVGTTAVVAVFSPSKIILANCGDSRAVLSRGGVAIPLTKDHKPDRDDENSRIEAAGGRVIHWDGYRVSGLLAVSRAIGDRYLKEYVISDPDVLCLPRTDDDECLILASDGLWDVINNETACDVARRCLVSARKRSEHRRSRAGEDTASAAVAALLVKLAYGRGSKDNISVVVIDLKSDLKSTVS